MIRYVLMNLLLCFVWVALTGDLVLNNFIFGYALGFFILWVIAYGTGRHRKYFLQVPKIIQFAFYFLYEILKANVEIAYDLITPRFFMKPGIVRYPLDAKTDFEITMLCNVISLTPGTLIIDVSDDRTVVYIHVTYLKDRDAFVRQIKTGFEAKLLDILR